MLVRFLGFTLESKSNPSVNDLMNALSKVRTSEDLGGSGRFLFIDSTSNSNYHLGLVVTVKSQKKFCELMKSAGSFKVKVNNLKKGHKLMEFNFFVVNKATGAGVYQHYHQSCSLGQAMFLLQSKCNDLRDSRRKSKAKELMDAGMGERKARRLANEQHQGFLKWEQIVRPEKLKALLAELESIRALEIDFSTYVPEAEEYQQLTGLVKKERKIYTFTKGTVLTSLSEVISSTLKKVRPDTGRVFGRDTSGLERIIKIQDNPDNFGEYDFDEVAEHINELDVTSFADSWIIQKLLDGCVGKPLFEAKRK